MNFLFTLTETDKRVLIALCFVLIFVFVVAGYIGLLISRVMKHQGMKMDTMMHDIVITRVVTNKKEFLKVARKKNWFVFFKATWIPLLILLVAFIIWITAESVHGFQYNMFDTEKQGFRTLFFTFDWSGDIYADVFGMKLLAKWPEVKNTPHFEVEALFSYFFLPIFLTGAIWYLINLQSLIARTFKMYRLADAIYVKDLTGYNVNKENIETMRTNQANMNQMMWNQVMSQVNGIPNPNTPNLNNQPQNPPVDNNPNNNQQKQV